MIDNTKEVMNFFKPIESFVYHGHNSYVYETLRAIGVSSWLADTCVWNLRLPRIMLGVVAGIGLAIAGSVMQGVLKNPLASPYTLGISAGSGFGAFLAIIAGAGGIDD